MKKILLTALLIASIFAGRSQSLSFSGNFSNNKLQLNWSTSLNESTDRFEVEKSYDGINFTSSALVFTSEKKGPEDYMFSEKISASGPLYYRLKIISYEKTIRFSKVIYFPIIIDEKKAQKANVTVL